MLDELTAQQVELHRAFPDLQLDRCNGQLSLSLATHGVRPTLTISKSVAPRDAELIIQRYVQGSLDDLHDLARKVGLEKDPAAAHSGPAGWFWLDPTMDRPYYRSYGMNALGVTFTMMIHPPSTPQDLWILGNGLCFHADVDIKEVQWIYEQIANLQGHRPTEEK